MIAQVDAKGRVNDGGRGERHGETFIKAKRCLNCFLVPGRVGSTNVPETCPFDDFRADFLPADAFSCLNKAASRLRACTQQPCARRSAIRGLTKARITSLRQRVSEAGSTI